MIEAGLAAVVIALGLVAITRGLGSSLSTLGALQRRDALLTMADSTLEQLRAEAQQNPPLPQSRRQDACGGTDCRWELTDAPFEPSEFDVPAKALRLVTLTVTRGSERVRAQVIWPGNWLLE